VLESKNQKAGYPQKIPSQARFLLRVGLSDVSPMILRPTQQRLIRICCQPPPVLIQQADACTMIAQLVANLEPTPIDERFKARAARDYFALQQVSTKLGIPDQVSRFLQHFVPFLVGAVHRIFGIHFCFAWTVVVRTERPAIGFGHQVF
jgi:hypothetical protein